MHLLLFVDQVFHGNQTTMRRIITSSIELSPVGHGFRSDFPFFNILLGSQIDLPLHGVGTPWSLFGEV